MKTEEALARRADGRLSKTDECRSLKHGWQLRATLSQIERRQLEDLRLPEESWADFVMRLAATSA